MHTLRGFSLALLAAVLGACAPATTATPGAPGAPTAPGAATARAAVEQFLAAVRAEDIQAMSAVWGTAQGSVRETMERTEMERRAIIMHCFLSHDQFRIVNESPGEGGRRIFRVALTRGTQTRQPAFFTIAGPRARWYVENVELAAVREFCGMPPGTGAG